MSFEIQIRHAFPDANIELSLSTPSKIVGLFGPSGCGKTSCLNIIAGLLKPDYGEIAVNGDLLYSSSQNIDISAENREIGYVFQDKRLFPHMNVRENLLFGSGLSDVSFLRLEGLIELLDLQTILHRKPRNLSGGEAQRVAIGRALLSNPKTLLLDEPMTGIDDARKGKILEVFGGIAEDFGVSVIMVSHDHDDLEALGAHIVEI